MMRAQRLGERSGEANGRTNPIRGIGVTGLLVTLVASLLPLSSAVATESDWPMEAMVPDR